MSTISEDRTFYLYLIQKILANPDRVTDKNTFYATFGEKIHCHFCYLSKILCRLNLLSLYWKVSQPNFHAKLRKTIKWATKMAIKIKAKRKQIEIDSPNFGLCACAIKKKAAYIQLAENYVFSVSNLFFFFSYSHGNWPKNGSKRRIWSKMR